MTQQAEIRRGSRSHGTARNGERTARSATTGRAGTRTSSRSRSATAGSAARSTSSSRPHSGASRSRTTGNRTSTAVRNTRPAETHRRPQSALKMESRKVDSIMRSRMGILFAVIAVLMSVLIVRVAYLQTVGRDKYLAASISQRTRVNTVRASRGVIFDRVGNELALSVPMNTIWADPRAIVDPASTSHALAGMLGMDAAAEAALLERLSDNTAKFAYVSRQIAKENAKAIIDLGLPGIYSYVEPARVIESGVAEAVIGQTDPDGQGTSGLELKFNDVLTGTDGTQVRQVDHAGRNIAGEGGTTLQPVPGDDVVLTLDKTIQYQMDQAVLTRVNMLNAKGGVAIAMDTKTGDILAMTNVRRGTDGVASIAKGNYAAVEAYEPGSVAKVFSISAAVNEGSVTPDTSMHVPGIVNIDNFPIRDAWPHGPIDMNVRTILAESSNIGTMMVGDTIGFSKVHDYLSAFGFGSKTGLDYPGESRGILKSEKKTYGTERETLSYGYGFAATPLQLISGVNVVANGGTYVAPRVVSATIDKSGKRHPLPDSKTRAVLKPEAAATMTDMMRDVICSGTGERAKVKGMEIAGKTGTGYKVQANGTYSTDAGGRRYFASFVGFFPAAAPRVTMLVSIDEPSSSSIDRFGGTAAAPVFAQLVPTMMQELGIQPTGTGTGCKGRTIQSVGH